MIGKFSHARPPASLATRVHCSLDAEEDRERRFLQNPGDLVGKIKVRFVEQLRNLIRMIV